MVIIGPLSNNTPGPSNAVQLVPNPKPLRLELCLICQNVKDSAGSSKLTSTEAGRQKIISTSRKLDDGLVTNIDQNRFVDIRYASNPATLRTRRKEQDTKLKHRNESLKNPIFHN